MKTTIRINPNTGTPSRGKDLAEGLPHQVRDDLPVGQRAVEGRAHGTQVFLPHIGMNWGGSVAECHNPLIKRSFSIQTQISMFLIL